MSVKDVVALLGAVGLNSPPEWVRPFSTLSNGEAFRTGLARSSSTSSPLWWTAESVRRGGRRLVAVTCHYDVLDRLRPDWVYDVASSHGTMREGCL
ncbi:hypothetical protein ACIBQ1_40155 [Nonomuraea sp. NPDC050153]|uniref:hypothetical protein n=1 Tax=Nonomuraea sp. NPDC050153 TaxID=3364359 RepID=UPI003794E538